MFNVFCRKDLLIFDNVLCYVVDDYLRSLVFVIFKIWYVLYYYE